MSKEILIESQSPEEFEEIFDALKARGLKKKDYEAYLPYPSHRLLEKMRPELPKLSPGVTSALGALLGFVLGLAFQIYPNVYGYPQRVGGHAHFSWHAFLIIGIEMAILFGGLSLLAYLIFHLFHRGKDDFQILEECPSQMFALKVKNMRPSFEEEIEKLQKRFTVREKEVS